MLIEPANLHPWARPVTPVVVVRGFVPVAPYAAGGTNSVRLRTTRGSAVRAPCAGVVSFRGRVAEGPPTLTVSCRELRSTLRWVMSGARRGEVVSRGEVVGLSTTNTIGLSARLLDGTYRDPLGLLAATSPRALPPGTVGGARRRGARSRAPARRALAPVHLPASAFVASARSGAAAGHATRSGGRATAPQAPAAEVTGRLDVPLAAAGMLAVLAAVGGSAAVWLRRRRWRLPAMHRADLARDRR